MMMVSALVEDLAVVCCTSVFFHVFFLVCLFLAFKISYFYIEFVYSLHFLNLESDKTNISQMSFIFCIILNTQSSIPGISLLYNKISRNFHNVVVVSMINKRI